MTNCGTTWVYKETKYLLACLHWLHSIVYNKVLFKFSELCITFWYNYGNRTAYTKYMSSYYHTNKNNFTPTIFTTIINPQFIKDVTIFVRQITTRLFVVCSLVHRWDKIICFANKPTTGKKYFNSHKIQKERALLTEKRTKIQIALTEKQKKKYK